MHNDDEMVGRLLTRRELVALFGAAAAAAAARSVSAEEVMFPQGAASAVPNCVVHPRQMEGPYFVDEHLNRSDIRPDPSNGTVKPGAPFELVLNLTDVKENGACGPLVGAQVDLWQADAMGAYSDFKDIANGFSTIGEKFLRGYQVTDSKGKVKFTTIYPGWYPDRALHFHFKVRTAATPGPAYEFTSQLYLDDALTDKVHQKEPYASHKGTRTRNDGDFIYRDGGKQLLLSVVEKNGTYASTFNLGVQKGDDRPQRWGGGGGFGGPGGPGGGGGRR